jgi:hypothetical protein
LKISAIACVLICFLAAPELTKCQDFKGLRRTRIIIEDLGKDAENIGLTRESLEDQILVALKRDIPKLRIVDSPDASFVYLQLTSVQIGTYAVATFVQVCLERPAKMIGDDGIEYSIVATVWKRGTNLGVGGSPAKMASLIRDEISQAMTEFAAAYYKDNP